MNEEITIYESNGYYIDKLDENFRVSYYENIKGIFQTEADAFKFVCDRLTEKLKQYK